MVTLKTLKPVLNSIAKYNINPNYKNLLVDQGKVK